MSEETHPIILAGRRWDIPHLPFRAIKKIQPILVQIYLELGGAGVSLTSLARLDEAHLDRLADATYLAIAWVDPNISRDQFFDLPFSVGELMQAFPSLAQAAGLRAASRESALTEAPGE